MLRKSNILRQGCWLLLAYLLLLLFNAVTNWLLHNHLLPLWDHTLNKNPGAYQNPFIGYVGIAALTQLCAMILYHLIMLLLADTARSLLNRITVGVLAGLLPFTLLLAFTYGIRFSNSSQIAFMILLAISGGLIPWMERRIGQYWPGTYTPLHKDSALSGKVTVSFWAYVFLVLFSSITTWVLISQTMGVSKSDFLLSTVGISALNLCLTTLLYHTVIFLLPKIKTGTMVLLGAGAGFLSFIALFATFFDLSYSNLLQMILLGMLTITGGLIPLVEKRISQYRKSYHE